MCAAHYIGWHKKNGHHLNLNNFWKINYFYFSDLPSRNNVLRVYHIWPSRCHGLLSKRYLWLSHFRQNSIHAAHLQFKERFGCREFPVHSIIYRWVNKFRTHGTVHNLNRKDTNRQSHSGRPKTSRTPHNVAAVRDSVVHSPSKSVRRRSQELGINRESVRRILIADLHMYPCWMQIKHRLTPDDMRKRVIMCQWFATRLTLCQTFLTMSGFRMRHMFCCQVT